MLLSVFTTLLIRSRTEEDQIPWLQLLKGYLRRAGIELIVLVPPAQREPEVLAKIINGLADQGAAVEKQW